MNPDYLSLQAIRHRLGLNTDLDAYFLQRMREMYAASDHTTAKWTDVENGRLVQRPMTIYDAMAWVSHTMGGS